MFSSVIQFFGQLKLLAIIFIIAAPPKIQAAAAPDPFKAKPSYEDVFTRDIYDQRETLQQLQPRIHAGAITDQEIDQKLCDALHAAKQKQLDAAIVNRIRTKIEILQREAKNDAQRAVWSDILGSLNMAPLAIIAPPLVVGPIVSGLGNIILNKCYDPPEVARIKSDIAVLCEDIRFRQAGLTTEVIADLEIDYVKKKRRINNSELVLEIEKSLVDIRKSGSTPMEMIQRNFLERALNLPLRPHPIAESFPKLLQRFRGDPFFQAFSPSTRQQLEQVMGTVFYAASAPDDSPLPLREVCFCSGNPASGKSSGMERFAEKILGVPCFEYTVRDPSDLVRERLEGVERYRLDPDVGWLVAPLLRPDPGTQQTYSNAVLIINDLDRVLYSLGESPAALNFLLDYLDPRKRYVQHPYFNARIDISRLSIIVTVNEKLPQSLGKKRSIGGDMALVPGKAAPGDVFAALRSRVREIEFPDFEAKARAGILNQHVRDACIFYKVCPYLQVTFLESGLDVRLEEQFPGRRTVGELPPVKVRKFSENLREAQRDVRSVVGVWNTQLLEAAQTFRQEAERAVGKGKLWHLQKAVLCGDLKDAPYQIALIYKDHNENKDARFWAEMAAKNDNAHALYLLGEIFSTQGPLHDTDQAVEWMRQAAVKKHAGARLWLAGWHQRGNQLDQARDYLHVLAIEEDAKGSAYKGYLQDLYVLGEVSERKHGPSLANEQALRCFHEAANHGHVRTMFKLGWLNFHGSKFAEAKNWFEKASDLGDVYALNFLGILYLRGLGIKKDEAKGMELITRAAKVEETVFTVFNSKLPSSAIRERLATHAQGYQSYSKTRSKVSFRSYYSTKIDEYFGIDGDICMIIGYMYYNNVGLPPDTSLAKEWFKRSKELGNLLGTQYLEDATSCVVM